MKALAVFVITVASLLAQDGTPVNVSIGAPLVSWSTLYFYSGSDLAYLCKARSQQPTSTFARSDASLTNIVDATNTSTITTASAHGLAVNDKIVISGATVATALNGTYTIVTVGSATTFTITTSGVSDATFTESTLKFTTTAPRDTLAIWSIQKFTYVAGAITQAQWANGTSAPNQICANRTTLTFQ
jgi:hypothetical protein